MSDPRLNPSIFTRGAVDLSALRAPARPQAGAATGPTGTGAPAPGRAPGSPIIDVTEASFQTEVLERSLTTPVVIDFWADWCQPCKQLSPVLEKLAVEGGGSWVLAKIDVDANPRLSEALQIQGIPAVFVAIGGRLAPGFTGVIPESQLRPFIAEVLKASGVEYDAPADPRLSDADDALMSGDLDAAETAYRKILAESPADAVAEAGLAQVSLLRRVSGTDPGQVLAAAQAAPHDIAAQSLAADIEVVSGLADRAYARLVDLVRHTSGADRDKVRAHLVSLFTIAGPDDPAVAAARRALASALF